MYRIAQIRYPLLLALFVMLALSSHPAGAEALGQSQVYLPLMAQPGGGAPSISSFTATPSTIAPGNKSTLAWNVSGAATVTIKPAPGLVTGTSADVSPPVTTEYTLSASNKNGTATASLTVNVVPEDVVDSGTLWLPYSFTGNTVLSTYGTQVAVDGSGGIHAAYAIFAGTDDGLQPAVYAYCPSQCYAKGNWSSTRLGDAVRDVRLALDPAGHPRLLLFGPIPDPYFPRMRHQYAACDSANCAAPENWSVATIVTPIEGIGTREANNNRHFAIDALGRPAFVYTDSSQNNHGGTFYMSCAQACTTAANWTETTLLEGFALDKPSLAFSPSGQPRLAFTVVANDGEMYLGYAECDANCTETQQWSIMLVTPVHGTAKVNLRVNSKGHPRFALYSGSYSTEPLQAGKLYYNWCNVGCATSGENWFLADVGLDSGSGDGVDLVLDQQDRPRVSYSTAMDGLGYAWCNASCESSAGVWNEREIESKDALAQDFEVLPIRKCTVSTWHSGQRTSLALDASGNPRIGYDAQHWWYGVELTGGGTRNCDYQDATVTRLALFDQP